MTTEILIGYIAGGIFSLLQELVDGWSDWLKKQSEGRKRLISIGASAVAALIVFGLACGNVLSGIFPDLTLACNQEGALMLVALLIGSLTGNQTTHLVVKKSG